MALACVSLKEYDQARELYQKAIEIMSALPGGKPETAITYLNLANAAEAQQGLENASEFITDCLQRLKIFCSMNQTRSTATTLSSAKMRTDF